MVTSPRNIGKTTPIAKSRPPAEAALQGALLVGPGGGITYSRVSIGTNIKIIYTNVYVTVYIYIHLFITCVYMVTCAYNLCTCVYNHVVPSGTLSARTGESAKLPVRARLSSFRSLWAVFCGGTLKLCPSVRSCAPLTLTCYYFWGGEQGGWGDGGGALAHTRDVTL